jgi:hypothetical protein
MFTIAAVLALPLAALPLDSDYEVVVNTNRQFFVWRVDGADTYVSIGKLDAAGNVVPDEPAWVVKGFWSGLREPLNSNTPRCYEYRSGILILGELWKKELSGSRSDPVNPASSGAGVGSAADVPRTAPLIVMHTSPAGDYEFVRERNRWVEVQRRDRDQLYWSIGKLDPAGNFVPDKDYLNRTDLKPTDAPAAVLLNRDGLGPVYEYRSGRLVRGRIDPWTRNFVPEVGSTVLDFKDYRYGSKDSKLGPEPLPIWNLPGTFRKKDADKK